MKYLQNRVEDHEGKKQNSFNEDEPNANNKSISCTLSGSSTVEQIMM
jgi:hypothetical protein